MANQTAKTGWVKCEVKSGPFSDERTVRVVSGKSEAVAFVGLGDLKEPITSGSTLLRVKIIGEEKGQYVARMPGISVASKSISIDKVELEN